MKNLIPFIADRLKERSTWLGLTSVATALGLLLTPTETEAIVAFGMAAGGLVTAFTRDKTP